MYNWDNLFARPGKLKMSKHQELLQEFRSFADTAANATALMTHISQRLHSELARYNWVGFYLVDKADPGMLVVGPYVGSFSPNTRIPINKGLCGAAATTKKTVVVNDVANDPRYLSGSEIVKANMVVLFWPSTNSWLSSILKVISPIPSPKRSRPLRKRWRSW